MAPCSDEVIEPGAGIARGERSPPFTFAYTCAAMSYEPLASVIIPPNVAVHQHVTDRT